MHWVYCPKDACNEVKVAKFSFSHMLSFAVHQMTLTAALLMMIDRVFLTAGPITLSNDGIN
jgi:hypothetical protein